MLGLEQLHNGAVTAREGGAAPASDMGRLGYQLERSAMAVESRDAPAPPVASSPTAETPRRSRRRSEAILAVIGALIVASTLGYAAYDAGHPLATAVLIGTLGGVTGGAAGAAIVPALRAVWWAGVAAAIAALGAGALWLVHRIDPLLLRPLLDRLV